MKSLEASFYLEKTTAQFYVNSSQKQQLQCLVNALLIYSNYFSMIFKEERWQQNYNL